VLKHFTEMTAAKFLIAAPVLFLAAASRGVGLTDGLLWVWQFLHVSVVWGGGGKGVLC
jgi:hypothetical protein